MAATVLTDSSWAGRWSNLGADHLKRWEKRLYVPKSGGSELRKLAIRLQHLGRRDEFRFETTNRQAAATQALDVFRFLKANGWDATLAKYKPATVIMPKLDATVGDFLNAVEQTHSIRQRTYLNYRNCFRTIVAESFKLQPKKGENKYDYRAGGNKAWVQRIDEIWLARITPERVDQWKRWRLGQAGHSPAALSSTRRTINSYTRDNCVCSTAANR